MHFETASTELLVIQPTAFCNLDCSYCYLPFRDDKRRMSDECLRRIADLVFASPAPGGELTVIWHAGEPMVLPANWYRDAFEIIESRRSDERPIAHAFQTNATLIDDEWIDLLRRDNVRLGVSVDGPAEIHDKYRFHRNGRGSFDATMSGIRKLQENDLPFHTISVLTADSLARPEALADFFIENELREICLNVDELDGINRSSTLDSADALTAFRTFLHRFLDRLESAPGRSFWVREVQNALDAIRADPRNSGPVRNIQTTALAILAVDSQGSVSTYSPELLGLRSERYGALSFGSVFEIETLSDILRAPNFGSIQADIEKGVERCASSCEYFMWCGGGAPANKLGETGRFDTAETQFCRLTVKSTLEVVLDRLGAPLKRTA